LRRVFSVGIGLTNGCNLRCAHCYRPDMVVAQLTRSDVRRVCDAVTAGSINLGVGENGLHPEYRGILDDLGRRGIKTSITSNGLSIHALEDEQLRCFHSVELSLDFPTEGEHDAFRGAGNWRAVVAALERCAGLRVPVTVTAVMMTINYRRLPALARVAAGLGANLRVNVYQPSRTDRFTLTYEQLWDGFRGLAAATRLVATTEPVLAGVLGLDDFAGPGCGRSTVRIAPDGRVLPCTYWPGSRLTIADLERAGGDIVDSDEFVDARRTPSACVSCPCRGGCAGRRALTGKADAPDPYCPFARGEWIALDWERADRQDLPKVGSACTTVVSAL
jgi:radical SAM protein with 4Fe4S-binding SPASM domain